MHNAQNNDHIQIIVVSKVPEYTLAALYCCHWIISLVYYTGSIYYVNGTKPIIISTFYTWKENDTITGLCFKTLSVSSVPLWLDTWLEITRLSGSLFILKAGKNMYIHWFLTLLNGCIIVYVHKTRLSENIQISGKKSLQISKKNMCYTHSTISCNDKCTTFL